MLRVPEEGDLEDVAVPEPEKLLLPKAEDNPFAPATDAEKVSYSNATGPAGDPEPGESPGPLRNHTASPAPPAAAPAAHTAEMHCVCPVCQSELRISVAPEPVLHEAAHAAAPSSAVETLPMSERERQIAAARERVLHTTGAKPRLDRVLAAADKK